METIFLDPEKIKLFLGVFLATCLFVVGAIMLDLWDGVHTARKTNQRVHSHKLRVTIEKTGEYFRFVLIGFLIDCIGMFFSFYPMPFLVSLFGIGLIIVEIKSMLEHAKRRNSHTAELPDIIKGIKDAASEKEAKDIIEQITALITDTKH